MKNSFCFMRPVHMVKRKTTILATSAFGALWLGAVAGHCEAGYRNDSVRPVAAQEESLLVAPREAPATSAAQDADSKLSADDDLEPISQTPERTPELATTDEPAAMKNEGAGDLGLGT